MGNELINVTVGVGVGALIILALAAVVLTVRKWQESRAIDSDGDGEIDEADTNPTIDAILDALMPTVYKGIVAGEKMSVLALKRFKLVLEGEDKQAVADSLYNLLPDVVMVAGQPLPINLIKRLITKDDFSNLVKNVYDEIAAFLSANAGYIEKSVRDLLPDDQEGGLEPANGNAAGDTSSEAA